MNNNRFKTTFTFANKSFASFDKH